MYNKNRIWDKMENFILKYCFLGRNGSDMERMKTFLIYALLIIGFFILSVFLENGLLMATYSSISGEFNGNYENATSPFTLTDMSAKSCNVNGYINFKLINTTGNSVEKCYLKIELYNQQNLLAGTEYVEILGMQKEEVKEYNIKFKANHVKRFSVDIVQNMPDKTNKINILGWEIDLSNVFGLGIDLSNVTIFGTKLTDLFTWNHIQKTGFSFWEWLMIKVKSVPGWAYFAALFFII